MADCAGAGGRPAGVCTMGSVVSVDWCMQGWNLAMKNAQLYFPERAEEIDALIKQRISGNLKVQHPPSSLLSYTHVSRFMQCSSDTITLGSQNRCWPGADRSVGCFIHLGPGSLLLTITQARHECSNLRGLV